MCVLGILIVITNKSNDEMIIDENFMSPTFTFQDHKNERETAVSKNKKSQNYTIEESEIDKIYNDQENEFTKIVNKGKNKKKGKKNKRKSECSETFSNSTSMKHSDVDNDELSQDLKSIIMSYQKVIKNYT